MATDSGSHRVFLDSEVTKQRNLRASLQNLLCPSFRHLRQGRGHGGVGGTALQLSLTGLLSQWPELAPPSQGQLLTASSEPP